MRVLEIEPDYVVCSNGTVILKKIEGDEVRYEQVHTETFDATEVVTLLREHLPDAKYMVELEDGSRLYTEELDDWNLLGARRVAFDELTREPVCRVVVVSPMPPIVVSAGSAAAPPDAAARVVVATSAVDR